MNPQSIQTHGTFVDGSRVPPNKPVVMKDGATLSFGGAPDAPTYVVRCESAAEKRRGDGSGEQQLERKRSAAGEPASVRCSHLLVKHSGSRRPSSWKVGGCRGTHAEGGRSGAAGGALAAAARRGGAQSGQLLQLQR